MPRNSLIVRAGSLTGVGPALTQVKEAARTLEIAYWGAPVRRQPMDNSRGPGWTPEPIAFSRPRSHRLPRCSGFAMIAGGWWAPFRFFGAAAKDRIWGPKGARASPTSIEKPGRGRAMKASVAHHAATGPRDCRPSRFAGSVWRAPNSKDHWASVSARRCAV